MPVEIWIAIIGTVSAGLGWLIAWILNTRKTKAETDGIELDNVNKVIDIWRQLSEEQAKKIQALEKKVDELQNNLSSLAKLYEAQCDNCQYKKSFNAKLDK